ncbi:type I polyketide synthase [Streptomyces pristinaespiralis]|uniref:type I polyketide synthase n=1 Tax=Streptomyces pristinaespiralis TaxID=38300 RepID=UPI00056BCC54|nr:type I polyketide synthase [Streptomyces pristinaespiralis]
MTQQHEHAEAIAVVGIGCRLPGGIDTPDAYWTFLTEGREAVGDLPEGRWDAYRSRPGLARALAAAPRRGAFLADAAGFDAAFFGITPREAELMDPQQRLTLETGWEALEDAGIAPHTLAGSDAGVFMGAGSDDYGRQMLEDLPAIEAWSGIGASLCAIANRLSYVLDLRGPSLVVDTACSSSLAALHLACQSLRARECTHALAGGVHLVAAPGLSMVLDAAGATSRDGRSKSFDAAADGYGRGEGVGVVVLKRLFDALADGDPVRAVIRGSALAQDGRTNGIMAPSGAAQERVVRAALEQGGVEALSVSFVEAHGTGTRVGDPVEVGALARVFGVGRAADRPCLIGSVKANIGHLEAGAGVAGVIKAVLALQHGVIPPTANVHELNPDIDWAASGLAVPTEPVPWPEQDTVRRAGVSGFGYGGTVGHVVLEQAPDAADTATAGTGRGATAGTRTAGAAGAVSVGAAGNGEAVGVDAGAVRTEGPDGGVGPEGVAGPEGAAGPDGAAGPGLFVVSGASGDDVRAQAASLAAWLRGEGAGAPLDGVAHTLMARRSHAVHRAAAVAEDHGGLAAALEVIAGGGTAPAAVAGQVLPRGGDGAVWVFSGHGSQWEGMGRELLATEPVFADAVDRLEPVFAEELGISPRRVLSEGPLGGTDHVQPMIFVVQVGLDALLRAKGLTPAAVVGHSVGEIAAAVSAGVLGPADAARLICRRSVLLRRVMGRGAMAMAGAGFEAVQGLLGDRTDVVAAIAASPASTVVSGTPEAVEEVCARLEAEDVMVRRVASDVAFHSPQMDPLLEELAKAAHGLEVREPRVPLYSTALEDPRSTAVRDGAYWAANLRNPVRLEGAVRALAEDGYRVFVELSGHPVVTHSVGETLEAAGLDDVLVTATLRRERPERATLLAHLGALHCHGAADGLGVPHGPLTALPRRAWQHVPYWRTPSSQGPVAEEHDTGSGTLLGGEVTWAGAVSPRLWRTRLDEDCRPYPGSHPIHGVEVVPAAVLLNTFLAAGGTDTLQDVALKVPVAVTGELEVHVVRDDSEIRLASRRTTAGAATADPADGAAQAGWSTHTTARLVPDGTGGRDVAEGAGDDGWEESAAVELDPGAVNERLHAVGVADVGFPWRITELASSRGQLRARVRPAADGDLSPALARASLLDAVFSVAPLTFPADGRLRMPAAVRRVRLPLALPEAVVVHISPSPTAGADTTDAVVRDEDGHLLGTLEGLVFATLDGGAGSSPGLPPQRLTHTLGWSAAALTAEPRTRLRTLALVGEDAPAGLADDVTRALGGAGLRCLHAKDADALGGLVDELGPGDAVVVLPDVSGPPAAAARRSAWRLASTAQLLLDRCGSLPPRLWALTRGAWEAAGDDAVAQSAMLGLIRIVAGEHPELHARAVDLDTGTPPALLAGPLAELLRCAPEADVYRVGEDGVRAARLTPLVPDPDGQDGPNGRDTGVGVCRADGTYLITGGFGALGRQVADWLAGRGARRILLAGRTALPPRRSWAEESDPATVRRIEAVRRLEARGVSVTGVAVDIADGAAARAALDTDALGLPPVRGVVHAAGVLDDRMLVDLDEASLERVLAPKAGGALVLHELFPPGSTDFFVLFSSVGYQLGLTGQSGYAAANACLDALARHRQAAGDAGSTAYAWTSWRGAGMAVSDFVDAELADRGSGSVEPADALRAWEYALDRGPRPYVAVLPVTGATGLPVLGELSAPGDKAAHGPDDAAAFRADGLTTEELGALLLAEVGRQIEAELGISAERLDVHRPLTELGLDSVMTQVLRRGLERRLGLKLPATLVWKHPTAAAVAAFLTTRLAPSPA